MGQIQSFVVLLGWIAIICHAKEVPRPRGVGPEFGKFYKNPDIFKCISNPTIEMAAAKVNDDYCDCPDGSDEPGTSACAYLSPLSPPSPLLTIPEQEEKDWNTTLVLPGFYCKNKGHRSSYIPFTHVNDGRCDHTRCCDGSDEWLKVGGLVCEDECKKIGEEWRKRNEVRQVAWTAGVKRRRELVVEAVAMRKTLEEEIVVLEGRVMAVEAKVARSKDELNEVEKRERSKTIEGSAGRINALVTLAKDRVEELRLTLMNVRDQRDAGLARVKELEGVLSTFKEEYNPNFNDEGVKRAVRAWEEYAARKEGSSTSSPSSSPKENKEGKDAQQAMEEEDDDLDEIVKEDGEGDRGIRWEDWTIDSESDTDRLYHFRAYLPSSLGEYIHHQLHLLRDYLAANGILAPSSTSSSSSSSSSTTTSTVESKALKSARTKLGQLQSELTNEQSQLTSKREDLARDFGPDEIFRAPSLRGKCIETEMGEYDYEVCLMERVTQKPKKGGAHTGLGNFVGFDQIHHHHDTDGGDDDDDHEHGAGTMKLAMRYENGQACWNGPVRRTTVILSCGQDDVIHRVVEEEKCVYRIVLGSPALCSSSSSSSSSDDDDDHSSMKASKGKKVEGKDEL